MTCVICGLEDAKGRDVYPHGWMCTSCKSCYWAVKKTRGSTWTSKWLKRAV